MLNKVVIHYFHMTKMITMKKTMYVSLFSLALLGIVSCGDSGADSESTNETEQKTEEAVTPEKKEEMDKTIKMQEEAEKLDKELDEFIKSL